ncbi:hypothetical protein Tco_0001537 [Tanacetum coccineum]
MFSSSTITYTSVYTDSEPGRVFWGADEELSDGGPEHPSSPDYMPGPEHLPLPVKVPYVPEPEYTEYLVPSDAEAPLEDQPPPADASPTALSPGYVADSDPDEDPEEDHEEDHAYYPADGGDGDDETSDDDDDDDTDDEDEEPFEDEDDDDEEEPLALADSSVIPVTRLRRARKTVRLEPPMSPSMEARITEYAAVPTPPSPPPSPLSPWEDIPKAELPPRKRLCPTAPTSRYEVGESSTAAPRPTGGHRADYGFIGTIDVKIRRQRAEEVGYGIRDVWVDLAEAVEEVAPTTLEGVNARVTELATVQEQDTHDIFAIIEDGQDRQTQLSQRVDVLTEDRQLSAALGQIQALQARDQTHADDPEGAGSFA